MSPVGIFIYDIDESFGPKIIADFYLKSQQTPPEALKKLSEKHKKDLVDASFKTNKFRYYSSLVDQENLKEEVYLGFVLNLDEDVVSLKSVFESIEKNIVANFTRDKKQMQSVLKQTLASILSLMEKLKEPKIIQEKINEKTKVLLDQGKLQEARDLISLGEKIPKQLSATVKSAEKEFQDQNYKKAKKYYLKAADLAEQIEEMEMVEILTKKGETAGDIPILQKEQESLNKELRKVLGDLEVRHLNIAYKNMLSTIDENIKISNQLEDNEFIELLEDLRGKCFDAFERALDLAKLDKEIKEIIKDF